MAWDIETKAVLACYLTSWLASYK